MLSCRIEQDEFVKGSYVCIMLCGGEKEKEIKSEARWNAKTGVSRSSNQSLSH